MRLFFGDLNVVLRDLDGRGRKGHERHHGERDDHDYRKQTRVRTETRFFVVWHVGSPVLM
jgi:hypothetical protein